MKKSLNRNDFWKFPWTCLWDFSSPEPKAQVYYCDHALSVVSRSIVRPLTLTFHIFDFFAETAEQNSRELGRKQDFNVLYQVLVFWADQKTKMACLPLTGWYI